MTEDDKVAEQMKQAGKTVHRYREALAALAGGPETASDELQARLEVARERLWKYQAVYRSLAR